MLKIKQIHSLSSYQEHFSYLLRELNFRDRRELVMQCKYSGYFQMIVNRLQQVTALKENKLTPKRIYEILVPKYEFDMITLEMVENAVNKIEMEYWAIIRYCEGRNKDRQEINHYKRFLRDLARRILTEPIRSSIPSEGIEFLLAIQNWELSEKIKDSPFKEVNDVKTDIPPFAEIQFEINQFYREVDFCFSIINEFAQSFRNNQEISILTRDKLIKAEIFNIIRVLDQFFLYNSTPRYKETIGRNKLIKIIDLIKNNEIRSVLDLFANSGLLGVISFLYNVDYIHINDIAYIEENSTLNNFLQGIQDLINRGLTKTSSEYSDLINTFLKDQIQGTGPLIPASLNFVNPINIWTLTGPPINLLEEYLKKITITNIKIDELTNFKEISNRRFDLIMIDPPFGNVSNYQVTENQGKKLLEVSIWKSNQILEKNGWVTIRTKEDWGIPLTPKSWTLHSRFNGRSNLYFFKKSN